MTVRHLHGLALLAWSPSHYQLIARDDDSHISLVSIVFDGAGWDILVLMKRGHTIRRGPYTSLRHACEVIAFGENAERSA
jgi:hypothetical protein